MAIDFPCGQCGQTLRTPDGTSGKQAKCPQCGAQTTIPQVSASPFAPPPREPEFHPAGGFAPPPRQETGNPYQSPVTAPPETVDGARGFRPSPIEFSTVFDRTWRLYKQNFGLLAGCGVIAFVLTLLLDAIVQRLFGLQSQQFGLIHELRTDDGPRMVRQFLAGLVSAAISAYFLIGLIVVTLKMARGERATVSDLFTAGPWLVNGIIVHWIVSFLTMVGLGLCIVPGVYVALALGLSLYMLVDQRTGIVDSLQHSFRAMQGNKLVALGLAITVFGLLMAVALVTCFLGLPLVWPFAVLMTSVAYLMATGQLPPERAQHPVDFGSVPGN